MKDENLKELKEYLIENNFLLYPEDSLCTNVIFSLETLKAQVVQYKRKNDRLEREVSNYGWDKNPDRMGS